MRQLIRTYKITGDHQITISNYSFTKEDIRLIINESLASTDKLSSVLVSSTAKDNIILVSNGVITLSDKTASLNSTDILTIEIDIDNIAKESTVIDKTQELQTILNSINNNVTSSKEILNGKLGDIYNYLILRFDQVYSYLASRFDQIHQFIANRADAILSQISLTRGDVTGAKSEILGKVGDVINRQSDFDNVNAARTRDVINTVNAQAQALSRQMSDNTNGVAKEGDNPEATMSAVYDAVLEIKDNMTVAFSIPENMITDIANGGFNRDSVSMFSSSGGAEPMEDEDIEKLVNKVYNNIKIEE